MERVCVCERERDGNNVPWNISHRPTPSQAKPSQAGANTQRREIRNKERGNERRTRKREREREKNFKQSSCCNSCQNTSTTCPPSSFTVSLLLQSKSTALVWRIQEKPRGRSKRNGLFPLLFYFMFELVGRRAWRQLRPSFLLTSLVMTNLSVRASHVTWSWLGIAFIAHGIKSFSYWNMSIVDQVTVVWRWIRSVLVVSTEMSVKSILNAVWIWSRQ